MNGEKEARRIPNLLENHRPSCEHVMMALRVGKDPFDYINEVKIEDQARNEASFAGVHAKF